MGTHEIPAEEARRRLLITIGLGTMIDSAITSLDELGRRIQLEAIAIGFGGTAVTAMGCGMLGLADVSQISWL
jgi:glycerate kinase